MKYRITHSTTYQYSTPVSVCHNALILSPQVTSAVRMDNYRLVIRPAPEIIEQREDMFGNTVHRFSLEENHSQLTITSTSHVTIDPPGLPAPAATPACSLLRQQLRDRKDSGWLSTAPFRFDSPRIRRSDEFADYAAAVIRDDMPVVSAAAALTQQIFDDFNYDKNATDVDTPTDAAFRKRGGVCQDFAHIAVACLRSLRIPARYVSGYLRTHPPEGRERLTGADQSHAWVSVYCGADAGWCEFDPTNNCHCGIDHIPIARGRDYGDVVPIKGVFLGGGEPLLSVNVDVTPVDTV